MRPRQTLPCISASRDCVVELFLNFLEIEMNAKQIFAVLTLMAASGAALAQAPAADKPAAPASTETAKEAGKAAAGKSKSGTHDHKQDGPKKSIYSGA
jgi:hypothetical protein